mmetsp:Transcript_9356/g.15788  ORF Transcript_9356/g.15788 Transcript_9356/m.15788 type:complete len:212 (-) Transcript_9356:431-1066(-)
MRQLQRDQRAQLRETPGSAPLLNWGPAAQPESRDGSSAVHRNGAVPAQDHPTLLLRGGGIEAAVPGEQVRRDPRPDPRPVHRHLHPPLQDEARGRCPATLFKRLCLELGAEGLPQLGVWHGELPEEGLSDEPQGLLEAAAGPDQHPGERGLLVRGEQGDAAEVAPRHLRPHHRLPGRDEGPRAQDPGRAAPLLLRLRRHLLLLQLATESES